MSALGRFQKLAYARQPTQKSREFPTRSARVLLPVPAACHFEPVQFLLDAVERIVADLVVGTHGENGLARCLKGRPMDCPVSGAAGVAFFMPPGY